MEEVSATHEGGASSTFVQWAVGARTLPGETESGDLHLVAALPTSVLIAVVDGLGHGPEAAFAARTAMASLREHPQDEIIDLMRRCHASLRTTRGVVMSMAAIDAKTNQMTWLGVGNVDATLFRANPDAKPTRESLPHRGGVVGFQMPPLRITRLSIACGDTLVFATDGISSGFHTDSPLGWHPQDAADDMLKRYGKDTDDALVLVARYLGPPS